MSKKPPKVKLTFALEAIWEGETLINAVSDIRFASSPSLDVRVAETALVRVAIAALKRYEADRWEDWEDAAPAEEEA